jgi:hypothetical protein
MPVTYSAMNPTGKWTPGRREHEEALRADDLRRGLQQYLGEARMAQQANQFGQEMALRKLGLEQTKDLTLSGRTFTAEQAREARDFSEKQAGIDRTTRMSEAEKNRASAEKMQAAGIKAREPSTVDKFMNFLRQGAGLSGQWLRNQLLQKQLELASVQPDPIDDVARDRERVRKGDMTPEQFRAKHNVSEAMTPPTPEQEAILPGLLDEMEKAAQWLPDPRPTRAVGYNPLSYGAPIVRGIRYLMQGEKAYGQQQGAQAALVGREQVRDLVREFYKGQAAVTGVSEAELARAFIATGGAKKMVDAYPGTEVGKKIYAAAVMDELNKIMKASPKKNPSGPVFDEQRD